MNAVLLDSSFNTILMHYDCYMFPLTKNTKRRKRQFTRSDFKKFANKTYEWASKAWFGSFYCEEKNFSDSLTLYFDSINWKTGDVNATLLIDEDETATAIGKLYIDDDLKLDFNLYDQFGEYWLSGNG